jgi:hypothetical protein
MMAKSIVAAMRQRSMHKYQVIWLWMLMLGACASAKTSPPVPNPRLQALQNQNDLISRQAGRCIDQATMRTGAQVNLLTAGGISPDAPQVRSVLDQGDGAIAKCRADEANAQAQLALQEQAEYAREAQAERERAALMGTLTSSLGH